MSLPGRSAGSDKAGALGGDTASSTQLPPSPGHSKARGDSSSENVLCQVLSLPHVNL